jgi:molybdate transport system substrate-binding protein
MKQLACAATLSILLSFSAATARTEELRIAVAANFLGTLQRLEREFEQATSHEITVIAGSTGLLYAQIRNGAPFDVLLAADQQRPEQLAADGFGNPASVFTYAIGRLVLWSADAERLSGQTLAQLPAQSFRWLAIAEPRIAPYGIAAQQTLEHLGAWDDLQPRIVKGQNIAQAFAMADTGNAELGFISLAQALARGGESSQIIVPEEAHEPIRQDAIVLRRAAGNRAAAAFVEFLQSREAAEIIEQSGYRFPAKAN